MAVTGVLMLDWAESIEALSAKLGGQTHCDIYELQWAKEMVLVCTHLTSVSSDLRVNMLRWCKTSERAGQCYLQGAYVAQNGQLYHKAKVSALATALYVCIIFQRG